MLSTKMKLSQQRVRTILKNLENTQEISTQTTNKYTVITICKYDSYQSCDSDVNQQITIKQPTINHQLTTNKNNKKEKNNKELILDYWIEYRKQIKKPIKEATQESILKKMQNFTEEDCKFVINNSIENGWQGLFWDKLPKHELTDDQQHYNNIMAKLNYKSNPEDYK